MAVLITPAEQTPEVQAQLDALIQTRVREDGDTLNPESITVLDPACGSGHILVVAYDVLKAIYLERGYQPRAVPRLILEKNLFGLDIDDRAAQMAGFALLMKARADDRRLFTATDEAGNLQSPKLNVLAMQSSEGMNAQALAQALQPDRLSSNGGNPVVNEFARDDLFLDTHRQMTLSESAQSSVPRAGKTDIGTSGIESAVATIIATFEHAKTFGSLIQISPQRFSNVRELLSIVKQSKQSGDLYAQAAAQDLMPLLQQALLLAMQFDAVVANPPYMNSKGMNTELKKLTVANFPDSKSDLFACFIERSYTQAKAFGQIAMVTMQSWMFLSSFEKMRERLLREKTIRTMVQIGFNSFPSLNSKIALATAFSLENTRISGLTATYVDLNSAPQSADKEEVFLMQDPTDRFHLCADELEKIPGSPIAYWVSQALRNNFDKFEPLHSLATPRAGMITGDNASFVRAWHEISIGSIGFNFKSREDARNSQRKWFPYQKGGQIRKWSGNREHVVDWKNDGARLRTTKGPSGNVPAHAFNEEYIFQPNVNWSAISIFFSARVTKCGALFDAAGSAAFPGSLEKSMFLAGFLNSKIAGAALGAINPTVNFQAWNIGNLPLDISLLNSKSFSETIWSLHDIAEADWNDFETSWDFQSLPIVKNGLGKNETLESSYKIWSTKSEKDTAEMQRLEEINNRIFIDAYGLADELTNDVPLFQITLKANPVNRYGDTHKDDELWIRFRQESCEELISYAIGCMMGRYSLDEPGLIYAHAGNVGFEPGSYATFPADGDGIVPITDELWFSDDACSRIREFLRAVWGPDTLEENMAWLSESLGAKPAETPDETIRRYIADKFFKDHLQTYKKRPIYWLFSSGKQGAFQALVYLHRYSEGTLARLRAEYVVPLTGKIQSRIEMLQKDANAASSTAARNKLAKEVEKLKKKHVELLAYDEQLRHYADMRINLDLDDGVKVNYGKFGDLLAEVKAVTGGAGDE